VRQDTGELLPGVHLFFFQLAADVLDAGEREGAVTQPELGNVDRQFQDAVLAWEPNERLLAGIEARHRLHERRADLGEGVHVAHPVRVEQTPGGLIYQLDAAVACAEGDEGDAHVPHHVFEVAHLFLFFGANLTEGVGYVGERRAQLVEEGAAPFADEPLREVVVADAFEEAREVAGGLFGVAHEACDAPGQCARGQDLGRVQPGPADEVGQAQRRRYDEGEPGKDLQAEVFEQSVWVFRCSGVGVFECLCTVNNELRGQVEVERVVIRNLRFTGFTSKRSTFAMLLLFFVK